VSFRACALMSEKYTRAPEVSMRQKADHRGSWRRRVEVESTTRSAKERVAGFEGREGHRTPFAPVATVSSFQNG
jgi:hypothetical protein